MYITAQRVRDKNGATEGINAFRHRHTETWSGDPPREIPDENPGELICRETIIAPGGNRVMSYLDIIAPEDTPWPAIRDSFLQFVSHIDPAPFPWVGTVGSLRFVTGMEGALAPHWQQELGALFAAAQRVGTRPAPDLG